MDTVIFLSDARLATHARGGIRVWDAHGGAMLHDLKTGGEAQSFMWQPPGSSRLLTFGAGFSIEEWDPDTGRHVRQVVGPGEKPYEFVHRYIVWSQDGERMAFTQAIGWRARFLLRVVDRGAGRVLFERKYDGDKEYFEYGLAPGGKYLVCAHRALPVSDSVTGQLTCWDLDAQAPAWSIPWDSQDVWRFDISSDGRVVCLRGSSRHEFRSMADGSETEPVPMEDRTYLESPDGAYLVDPGMNQLGRRADETWYSPSRSPQIRNKTTGKRAVYLAHTDAEARDYAFALDGRLAVARFDGSVEIWRFNRSEAWYGPAQLPAFWIALVLLILLAGSLKRDRKALAGKA
ncbi:MAG: WD40 repeat domain-containing protein [Planctomycetota bacterium]|nr:WD40 repeat domain-containing protein [Planctomycetota bacterium]